MSYSEAGKRTPDGRMDTPAFHRNHQHVLKVLRAELATASGDVLEVGSGSGQHAVQYAKAFPALTFWPSDLNPDHLQSIAAWRQAENLPNMRAPFQLDVQAENWGLGAADRPPSELAAIISLNMVHISPLQVAASLFDGAGKHLAADGKLLLYGPFKQDGVHTAPSNARFDEILRAQDPAWGVRDQTELEDFAQHNNLMLDRAVAMPSNNFTLIFARDK